MAEYIEMDACDLNGLIENVYGISQRDFHIPCDVMQDQRKITVLGVCALAGDDLDWTERMIQEKKDGEEGWRIHLQEGDYLLEFSH